MAGVFSDAKASRNALDAELMARKRTNPGLAAWLALQAHLILVLMFLFAALCAWMSPWTGWFPWVVAAVVFGLFGVFRVRRDYRRAAARVSQGEPGGF